MDHSDCIAVERTAARLALRHQCFQPVRQRLDGAQSDRPCRALEAVDPAIRFGEVEPRRIVACGRQIAQQGSDGLQMIPVFDPERRYQSLLDGAHTRYLSTAFRSEEHTSELQSLMRISYAVFCLKKTKTL